MINAKLYVVAEKINLFLAAIKMGLDSQVAINNIDKSLADPMEAALFEFAAGIIVAERQNDHEMAAYQNERFEIARLNLIASKINALA